MLVLIKVSVAFWNLKGSGRVPAAQGWPVFFLAEAGMPRRLRGSASAPLTPKGVHTSESRLPDWLQLYQLNLPGGWTDRHIDTCEGGYR